MEPHSELERYSPLDQQSSRLRQLVAGAVAAAVALLAIGLGIILNAQAEEAPHSGLDGATEGRLLAALTSTPGDAGGAEGDQMTVHIAASADGTAMEIVVDDPLTPRSDDRDATHCVTVTLQGPDGNSEARGCADPGGTNGLTASTPGEPLVGCAAVADATVPVASGHSPATSTFELQRDDVAPGPHRVTVQAVSGLGDGCTLDSPAPQNIATTTVELIVD